MRPAARRLFLSPSPRCTREAHGGLTVHGDGERGLSLVVSRRFDGWVSANVDVAAAAGPLRRWRPHPSNPLMRRRVPLALDEREYKADGTSRDQSPLPVGREHTEPRHRESHTTP
jgi:hypothetical protein